MFDNYRFIPLRHGKERGWDRSQCESLIYFSVLNCFSRIYSENQYVQQFMFQRPNAYIKWRIDCLLFYKWQFYFCSSLFAFSISKQSLYHFAVHIGGWIACLKLVKIWFCFFILPYRCVSFPLFIISCFLFCFSVISS